MEDSRPPESTAETLKGQGPIWRATAPQLVSELLTAQEAFRRFPGLHYKKIYAAAAAGLLHPVRPHGRVLYPEWELANLVKRLYVSRFDLDSAAA